MQSDEDMRAWAAQHHYPQLVIGERDVIRAGESSWHRFLASQDSERKARAQARMKQWDTRAA